MSAHGVPWDLAEAIEHATEYELSQCLRETGLGARFAPDKHSLAQLVIRHPEAVRVFVEMRTHQGRPTRWTPPRRVPRKLAR